MKLITQFEAEEKMTAEISNEEKDGTDSDTDSDPAGDGDVDASDDELEEKRAVDSVPDESVEFMISFRRLMTSITPVMTWTFQRCTYR